MAYAPMWSPSAAGCPRAHRTTAYRVRGNRVTRLCYFGGSLSVLSTGRFYVRPMDRREALRAATAISAGAIVSACDPGARPATTPATSSPVSAPSARPTTATTTEALPAEISHGPRERAKVALTFHGQGDPAIVARLLDEIAKGQAHVTVLAVGAWLAAQPGLARRIVDAGHELGNHTQHHGDIKRMSAARAHAEINDCAQALRSVTGSIGRWFRPSQTQHATSMIKEQARQIGYATCLSYDVDSLDYTDPGADAVVANTLKAAGNGSIISLHFGHAGTVTAMGPLLRGLRDRGLQPVTVSELIA
jgi:peptidoglycan/xylan/chitin deacetylase (PgdA/CDA1 family)